MTPMTLDEFQHLSIQDVANLVREEGPNVCVFPINGTRRWFILEYDLEHDEDFITKYLDIAGDRHIEIYKMIFDHGIDTLLTPVFGPDLMERPGYAALAENALVRLANNRALVDFYTAYNVRVRFYGDYRKFFCDTPYAYIPDLFDEITQQTMGNNQHRLFFGVCAGDATETVAEIGASFCKETTCLPSKQQIIEAYYGEYIEPVDIFIGFDKFSVFDMPLIATGDEDLYFTVSPSLYLEADTLRAILYDHIYQRTAEEPDYANIKDEDRRAIRQFYLMNRKQVQGIGSRGRAGMWYPLPQVLCPLDFLCSDENQR
jgi:tuberculosinol/isotuberculosinol synthase